MKEIKSFMFIFTLILGHSVLMAQITVSPWQIHEGKEGVVSHANPRNGDPSAYEKAKIPAQDDNGWKAAPKNSVGDVFIDRSSTVRCREQLDFTYFQTTVNIPANTKVDKFNVSYDKADDGARIYIFNTKSQNGTFDPASDLIISNSRDNTGNVNLKDKIVNGSNRIVIVQFDDCADRNTLSGINIKVNGTEIEPEQADEFPVTIFQHTNYGGKSQSLKAGLTNYQSFTIGNDAISSLKVSKCWKVTLYEHDNGGGKKLVVTENTPDLIKLNFNDKASSIRVEKDPGCNSSASVELPSKFKVLAYSVGEGKSDKDAYWFALNNGDSRGRILSQAKLGSSAKWMEIQSIDLGGDIYAFKVTNAGADMYLTARDNKEVHLEKASGGKVPEGAKFKSVSPLTSAPGAKERNFRSFQSVKFADHYLRHSGFAMFVHTSNGSELFKQDASWLIEKM
ncbi:MAG: AbfB domain-containing protein [Saprospiraceae bacterium]|nr:AbfB domain-containing protein [Saprospiraceae bacterium]MCF8249355.1 AbfB domain-containing protein [Saprospiraceae bacterium]MCF8279007.1 AbfB domain-containing protein [Bacteroidales bacterium]MCF8311484.1 AbfB domain-containing protein [Saprospiraceae bacterium]MCF8439974.1 AbfB domain-containing protein [Saprospiraceae bacterium]